MATILEFTGGRDVDADDRAAVDGSPTASTDGSAQIIFFPGVRIERYDIDPFLDDETTDIADVVTSSSA